MIFIKRIFLCLVCLVFVFSVCADKNSSDLLSETSVKDETAETESDFAGVWVTYNELSVKGKNYTEESYREYISSLFSSFYKKGINNVFFHVRAFSDAMYNSEIYPTSEFASGKRGEKANFDILKIAVEESEKYGLKIHAWINPYRVSSFFDENSLTEGTIKTWYENDTGDVAEVGNGLYLNPASENVRKLIVDGIREILLNYNVDGIHFDDYFYAENCGNFDEEDYENYLSGGGTLSLEEFRRENVNTLLSLSYSAVKSFGQNKIFSVSPAGDIEKNYSKLYADVSLWCKGGFCDMIIPQLYFGFLNDSFPFEETLTEWKKLCDENKVKLVPGLALYKCGQKDEFAGKGKDEWLKSDDIISRQIELIKSEKLYGYSFFSASYLNKLNFQ